MAAQVVPPEELSLCGMLRRLQLAEKFKELVRPTEEEAAVLASEASVKKAVAEQLPGLSVAGLTSLEKKCAKAFLEAQLKSVEPGTKGAEARKAKLQELMAGVLAAPSAEDPAHVRSAKAQVSRAEKDFEQIHKEYERWEKGKKMLSVDELKDLKRAHEEHLQRIEAAKSYVEQQLDRRPECAVAPPAALQKAAPSGAGASGSGRSSAKASGPGSVRGGGPAVRTLGGAPGGKAAGGKGYASGPASEAMRQAQLAAQVRAEVAQAWAAEDSEAYTTGPAGPPRPARPRPQREEGVQDRPVSVLSYACTVAAVAEICGISEAEARAMASSSLEFADHLEVDAWQLVQDRSVAIEKERREKQREDEKRKQAAALARKEKELSKSMEVVAQQPKALPRQVPVVGAAKPVPAGQGQPVQAKQKAKPKAAAPKKNALDALAHDNRFGGFNSDSSEEDASAWTQVKR